MTKKKVWKKNAIGEVVFKGTEEALEYAGLIFESFSNIEGIKRARNRRKIVYEFVFAEWKEMSEDVSKQATHLQFYNECLEEAARLRGEKTPKEQRDEE